MRALILFSRVLEPLLELVEFLNPINQNMGHSLLILCILIIAIYL